MLSLFLELAITKGICIHPLGTMKVCAKVHDNPPNSCKCISIEPTARGFKGQVISYDRWGTVEESYSSKKNGAFLVIYFQL